MSESGQENTGFLHMVYFWAAEGKGAEAAQKIAGGCNMHLRGIPGVVRLDVGFPAGTDRSVVDNSYAVGLLVLFADSAAHEVYQEHPDHLQFIAECSPYWSRVQVYDTLLTD